jgi:serine protease Do
MLLRIIPAPLVARCRGGAALLLTTAWLSVLASTAAQARDLPDFVELVEKVGPAVVNIRTIERRPDAAVPPLRRRLPAPEAGEEPQRRGAASGFIISADGYVMTNAHVVEGATEVLVTLTDRREFKARIIGADERTDVALVKIEAASLPVLKVGDVSQLKVGEWVLAIGSPFGLENTVTAGIVSAKQRETGSDIPFIQTDVAVNPGNSGGPLISIRGEVIGINSQILSPVGSFIGISFAIPIDEAMRVADQLRATGRVVRGYLGIGPTDVPRELAEEYGLGKGGTRARGAFVRQVVSGTPAERAGVQPGDVVLAIDGRAVDSAVDLRRTLGAIRPGTAVVLQINRRGKPLEIRTTLAEVAPQSAATEPTQPSASNARAGTAASWGLAVAELSDADREQLRGASGVKITAVSDAAEAVGLRAGDIILAVGTSEVATVGQFEAALARIDRTRALPVTALRGGWAQFVRIPALR